MKRLTGNSEQKGCKGSRTRNENASYGPPDKEQHFTSKGTPANKKRSIKELILTSTKWTRKYSQIVAKIKTKEKIIIQIMLYFQMMII